MALLHFIILFFTLASINGKQFNSRLLQFDKIDNIQSSWSNFYEKNLKERRPITFLNAFEDNKAYQLWSSDYIYYHPGAALTFRNLTKKNTASIRKIVEQKEYFMQFQFSVPSFLRDDLKIPKPLDCQQLMPFMDSPQWLWHFHENQIKLHPEKAHELWCMVRGTLSMTMFPKWTDGMIDHFVTEESLSKAPNFKDLQFYQLEMEKGHCYYVPDNFLRQWESTIDAMAVIFQINSSVLIDNQFRDCQSIEDAALNKILFADDNQKNEGFVENFLLQKSISYLGQQNCIDQAKFQKSLTTGSLIMCPHATKEQQTKFANSIFPLLDQDEDGEFCWEDVDALTLESAQKLAEKLQKIKNMLSHDDGHSKKKQGDEL